MSNVRIYIHVVWAVKNRYPLLVSPNRTVLITHFYKYCTERSIQLISCNGHIDHLHCLISLRGSQSTAAVVKLLKGESAWWSNKENLFEKRLEWSVGYYARSIDHRNLLNVKNYIKNQNERHKLFREVSDYLKEIDQENQ